MSPNQATDATRAAAVRSLGAFALVVVAFGLSITWLAVVPIDLPIARPLTLPWWLIAGFFYLTEVKVIHLHFRRESQAFSLNELPLVLGLFFIDPLQVVLAAVVGGVAGLVLSRKQRGIKLLVNTSHILLAAAGAAAVFHPLAGLPDPLSPRSWAAAAVAAVVAIAVNVSTIFAAVSISEGGADPASVTPVAVTSLIGTVTTTSLALVASAMLWLEPLAAVLILIPAIVLYAAFQAYTSEREKGESLEFLYESARILQEAPEVNEAITSLLHEAQLAFRAEVAEATIYPADPTEPVLRARVVLDGEQQEFRPLNGSRDELAFRVAVEAGSSVIVEPGIGDHAVLEDYLASRRLRDAMITPLRGETRIIGALMMANRLGRVSTFRDEELRLFETLASNASVSLENTRLERTLTELHALKEELRHQAEHDTLTGLANRGLFTERVQSALERARDRSSVAVLYLDLDDFKAVNDTFGHEAGDRVLRHMAANIRRSLRPNDLASRLGGDEFAILLERLDDPALAVAVAERIIASLRYPMRLEDREIVIRSSIGIAIADDTTSPADLIRNADVAMYRAKHHSKGRFAIFEEGMHADLADRLELRGQLLSGVKAEQFVVHYQPLYDLTTRSVVGLEALVRWEHPERGIVPPDEFISLAEETGLVIPIGDHVLHTATSQLARWQKSHSPGLVMSVNISARQLKHESLFKSVRDAIADSGIQPGSLILEITERDVMDDTETSLEKLAALKSLGVLLAIDDFGTGYSSLAYLRRFPIDIVKIAKPFVDTITQVGDGGVLAKAIIELSRALDMSTIAEGIEIPVQARHLEAWGCQVGQGYLFARVRPAQDINNILSSNTVGEGQTVLRLIAGEDVS